MSPTSYLAAPPRVAIFIIQGRSREANQPAGRASADGEARCVVETTYAATARKITRTLLAVQGLGQAAVVALIPIMAIVGAKLGGRPDWAGVPAMCYQLGQASAAYGWGYAMDPLGRRGMLMLGAPAGAVGALISTAAVIFLFLRPEPRDLGRAIGSVTSDPAAFSRPARSMAEIYGERPTQVATAAMVCGQLVMVMLMVITPLHMRGHNHAISTISYVISGHVVGMYAFSVISGQLTDRWGRGPVIMAGGAVLVLACLAATLSPQVVPLTVALFLLGLGWNLCYVGGSSLLADQLAPQERARTQGVNDLLIGLASAAGSLGSGIVFAGIGYNAMGLVSAATALIPLTAAALWRSRGRTVAVTP